MLLEIWFKTKLAPKGTVLPVSCEVLEWEIGTWLLLARGFSLLCIAMSGALELCAVHWSFPTKRRVVHLLFCE